MHASVQIQTTLKVSKINISKLKLPHVCFPHAFDARTHCGGYKRYFKLTKKFGW